MYRFSRTEHDAADLTQEVFLKAYEKLPRYKTGNKFFSWLYTMAINMARDWSRTRKRQNEKLREMHDQIPASLSTGSGQEKKLLHGENMNLLQRAMQMLPDDTREILMLRFRHERSVSEVADIFSMS